MAANDVYEIVSTESSIIYGNTYEVKASISFAGYCFYRTKYDKIIFWKMMIFEHYLQIC